MEHNIHKLFKDNIDKPEFLLSGRIWDVINARQIRNSKIKSWIYALLGTLSLVLFIVAVQDLVAQFSQSGFYEYLSLAFSDGGYVVANMREFALSLADSLPVTSLMFSLLTICILFISAQRAIRQFRNPLSLA